MHIKPKPIGFVEYFWYFYKNIPELLTNGEKRVIIVNVDKTYMFNRQ